MPYLMFLFFITSLFFLILGLIKPQAVSKFTKREMKRENIALLFGGLALTSFIFIGVFAENSELIKEQRAYKGNNPVKIEENIEKVADGSSNEDIVSEIDKNNDLFVDNEKNIINNDEIQDIEKQNDKFYTVTNVVDGDTIDVNIDGKIQRLRLIGLDTPETKDPRKPVECFGQEASDKAVTLLLNQKVRLEADSAKGEFDKYGRLLRYVFKEDGLFYNKWMIENGYAYEYKYDAPSKYQSDFEQAELYARNNKLGFWADGVCDNFEDNEQTTNESTNVEIYDENSEQTSCYCLSNKYNCSDFNTQLESQAIYDCCGGVNNDIHRLDRDGDGISCETLP